MWSWTSSLQRISSLVAFVPPVGRFSFSHTKFIFLLLWHKTTNVIVAFASNSDLELNGITIYDHLSARKWYNSIVTPENVEALTMFCLQTPLSDFKVIGVFTSKIVFKFT